MSCTIPRLWFFLLCAFLRYFPFSEHRTARSVLYTFAQSVVCRRKKNYPALLFKRISSAFCTAFISSFLAGSLLAVLRLVSFVHVSASETFSVAPQGKTDVSLANTSCKCDLGPNLRCRKLSTLPYYIRAHLKKNRWKRERNRIAKAVTLKT